MSPLQLPHEVRHVFTSLSQVSKPMRSNLPSHSVAEPGFGPRLGHQRSGPHWALRVAAHMGDVALRKRSGSGGWGVAGGEAFATWAAGAIFAAKSGLCLCLDVLVIVSLRRQPGVGPDGSGLGSEPGFLIPALP